MEWSGQPVRSITAAGKAAPHSRLEEWNGSDRNGTEWNSGASHYV